MKAQQLLIRLAAIAAGALAVVPATASAGIWTPTASNTTENITAVDYQAPDRLWYATAAGKIFKNGTQQFSAPGVSFNDLAMNPSGTAGVAVANGGKLYRFNGATWSLVSLANTSYTDPTPCNGTESPLLTKNLTPTGNLTAAAWSSDSTAYVTSNDRGIVLKTADGGASWTDASRQSDGECFVDPSSATVTDVKTIPGSEVVWFVDTNFGARSISSNGLASSTLREADSSVNCPDHRPQLALDTDNPNRSFVTDRCDGSLAFGFSEDGGATYLLGQDYIAGNGDSLTGLNDVAIAGGSALAVGNGGAILVSNNGRAAYFQRADGADATNDWLAVDKFDANHAAVGGRGGRLLLSDAATTTPDVIAPAGTVSGPVTVTAGTPATYTANVADNAGGSGIDPASFVWTSTGVPTATGNPATLTFPSAGYYSVKVDFKDLAGNAGSASISVIVNAPVPVKAPPPVSPTKTATASVPGAKISFGVPNTCVKAGSTFKVTLTWKKQKRKGNKFVKVRRADFYIGSKRVKIDKKAPFTQTLKVKAGTKAGSTITVKARAYVKVTKGKSPTKSISSKIKVCS
ncbi:MAG TPA: hypothetical protein VFY45_21065 [Baekduia sp.]|nr:hypothetical protein [Baekduia sp.]